ncbi:DUF1294 domain-containing protein [Chryseobacterium fluminis]|uniref:DUF1294 domain-containing protein n=1 Tax=Chryseobacterium fluminis TaxID=2983606 RepID=UPI002B25F781|nr:DUF1294 domain-containing protein [Chryseobacterium sp. MMS21-Ot14]
MYKILWKAVKRIPLLTFLFLFRFVLMLYVLLIINLLAFSVFAIDKRKAVKHTRRISELALLTLVFLGGTLGAILSMIIFRHKISKKSFLLKLGLIILMQIVLLYFLNIQFR